jgi:molybdopterin converting factor small subunit
LLTVPSVTHREPPVTVTVKLFATFREGRFETAQRDIPAGTTLARLVGDLGIAPEEVGVLLVGGRHAAFEQVTAPGDTIAIFPLLGGG